MAEVVLIIAAHPDDEVLGCGGTIARHVAAGDEVFCLFVADGETARIMTAKPNRNFAAFEVSRLLGMQPPYFLDLKDQRLDEWALLDIVQMIEPVVARVGPTVVYTHSASDLNQDHRIVHNATMIALRPLPGNQVRAVYGFEVPSSTEWGAPYAPTHFVNIHAFLDTKISALTKYHEEMRPFPHPRSYNAVKALAEIRGATCGVPAAEAFVTLRTIHV